MRRSGGHTPESVRRGANTELNFRPVRLERVSHERPTQSKMAALRADVSTALRVVTEPAKEVARFAVASSSSGRGCCRTRLI